MYGFLLDGHLDGSDLNHGDRQVLHRADGKCIASLQW